MIESSEFWTQHLRAISAEGISIKAYAHREGLSYHALYYWKKKLQIPAALIPKITATPQPATTDVGFVAIKVAAPLSAQEHWNLQLGRQAVLELPAYPDPHWLAELAGIMMSKGV